MSKYIVVSQIGITGLRSVEKMTVESVYEVIGGHEYKGQAFVGIADIYESDKLRKKHSPIHVGKCFPAYYVSELSDVEVLHLRGISKELIYGWCEFARGLSEEYERVDSVLRDYVSLQCDESLTVRKREIIEQRIVGWGRRAVVEREENRLRLSFSEFAAYLRQIFYVWGEVAHPFENFSVFDTEFCGDKLPVILNENKAALLGY